MIKPLLSPKTSRLQSSRSLFKALGESPDGPQSPEVAGESPDGPRSPLCAGGGLVVLDYQLQTDPSRQQGQDAPAA